MSNPSWLVHIEQRGSYPAEQRYVFTSMKQLQAWLREFAEHQDDLFHVTLAIDFGVLIADEDYGKEDS